MNITRYIIGSILSLTSILAPLKSLPEKAVEIGSSAVSSVESVVSIPIAHAFLGDTTQAESDGIVADQMQYVSSRGAYPASLAVVEKHADVITSTAEDKGVPTDVAIGVALLENGGSETAVSSAGAKGIYQLMPGTARALGLTVNKKTDDRNDPNKSIEAGVTYLANNYDRFGDWGLATWAYHAGEGNVSKAVEIYAKANDGIVLHGLKDSATMKHYILSHGVTVHKLLADKTVQKFTDKLHDDSSNYPFKVVATSQLYREARR